MVFRLSWVTLTTQPRGGGGGRRNPTPLNALHDEAEILCAESPVASASLLETEPARCLYAHLLAHLFIISHVPDTILGIENIVQDNHKDQPGLGGSG